MYYHNKKKLECNNYLLQEEGNDFFTSLHKRLKCCSDDWPVVPVCLQHSRLEHVSHLSEEPLKFPATG